MQASHFVSRRPSSDYFANLTPAYHQLKPNKPHRRHRRHRFKRPDSVRQPLDRDLDRTIEDDDHQSTLGRAVDDSQETKRAVRTKKQLDDVVDEGTSVSVTQPVEQPNHLVEPDQATQTVAPLGLSVDSSSSTKKKETLVESEDIISDSMSRKEAAQNQKQVTVKLGDQLTSEIKQTDWQLKDQTGDKEKALKVTNSTINEESVADRLVKVDDGSGLGSVGRGDVLARETVREKKTGAQLSLDLLNRSKEKLNEESGTRLDTRVGGGKSESSGEISSSLIQARRRQSERDQEDRLKLGLGLTKETKEVTRTQVVDGEEVAASSGPTSSTTTLEGSLGGSKRIGGCKFCKAARRKRGGGLNVKFDANFKLDFERPEGDRPRNPLLGRLAERLARRMRPETPGARQLQLYHDSDEVY